MSGLTGNLSIFLFKFSKTALICFLRSAGFSKNSIINPVLLKVMTGPAFRCYPKQPSPIFRTHLGHMLLRIKFFMNMATCTIFTNHFIISFRVKLSLERTGKFQLGAACF